MDSLIPVILISLVQGITEFLPISSSGHLVLLPTLAGFADQGAVMDVAAHMGSFFAVLIYLRRDIIAMLASLPSIFSASRTPFAHLALLIVLASLPAIAAGLVVELIDPEMLRAALVVAVANLVFALWLYLADKKQTRYQLASENGTFDWSQLSLKDAMAIGLAQCCALIPGASRSGVTMTMARQLGYDRLSAARFSLLLSLPIILGAGTVKTASLLSENQQIDLTALAGVIILSFICAFGAIRWMMGWLKQASFTIFIIYRLALGIILLGLIAAGIIA